MLATTGKASASLMLVAALLGGSSGASAAEGQKTKDSPKETKAAEVKPRIAVFRLNGKVTESPAEESFSFGGSTAISLKDLVGRLKKAGDDPDVKALVVLDEGATIGRAQIEELRQAMTRVRAAGKEIFAHSDSLSMHEYVLLSGVSRLSIVPTADLWVTGLYGESPYLRGLLNKLGVTPEFLTCGAYKSAAEMFLRDGPSPEAEAMQNWMLDSLYDSSVALIARGRGVGPDKVRTWINRGPYTAEKAREAGLVDAVEHRQEFEQMLKTKFGSNVVFDRKYGQKQSPKLDFSSPFALLKVWGDILGAGQAPKRADKAAVGIVYIDGPITLGGGQASLFDEVGARSSKIRKALDEAARDDSIKAVVLRVNSPGGSAVASEIILDATRRVKAKKPFVVSMGDVAGSGGYYVACASDVIFADEATITGSIGVVAGKIATTEMWKKLGVTFKSYKRGENAGMLSSGTVFSAEERLKMQAWMDEIYEVFKGHVRSVRGDRLKKPLDELAGGRVFTGRQALDLGLVDRIGTLQDAITYVADRAKLSDVEVRVVPAPKSFLESLLEETTGEDDGAAGVGVLSETRAPGQTISLVELALPFLKQLDSRRAAVVKQALQRLQLLNQHGVILMMPEILFQN